MAWFMPALPHLFEAGYPIEIDDYCEILSCECVEGEPTLVASDNFHPAISIAAIHITDK